MEEEMEFYYAVAKDETVKVSSSIDVICDFLAKGFTLLVVSDVLREVVVFATEESKRRACGS